MHVGFLMAHWPGMSPFDSGVSGAAGRERFFKEKSIPEISVFSSPFRSR